IVRTSRSSNCPAEQGAEGELAFGYGPERPRALLPARFAMASADGTAVAPTHDRGRNWVARIRTQRELVVSPASTGADHQTRAGSPDRSRDGLARITRPRAETGAAR